MTWPMRSGSAPPHVDRVLEQGSEIAHARVEPRTRPWSEEDDEKIVELRGVERGLVAAWVKRRPALPGGMIIGWRIFAQPWMPRAPSQIPFERLLS